MTLAASGQCPLGPGGRSGPRSLSRETSSFLLFPGPDSPRPPVPGHLGRVLARLNLGSPGPCGCLCWCGPISRQNHVTPGVRVQRGSQGPGTARGGEGDTRNLTQSFSDSLVPALSPQTQPLPDQSGGPQTPADPPRDPRLPLPWPAAHTPACSCEAVTASPSVHPQLSPGHWALEVPGSETPDASPEKAQRRLRGRAGAGR